MRFTLTVEQHQQIRDWDKTHYTVCTVQYGAAIGGRLTYKFTPTGLGTVCKVKCACGEEKDVSDYEYW